MLRRRGVGMQSRGGNPLEDSLLEGEDTPHHPAGGTAHPGAGMRFLSDTQPEGSRSQQAQVGNPLEQEGIPPGPEGIQAEEGTLPGLGHIQQAGGGTPQEQEHTQPGLGGTRPGDTPRL
jgi:hypothetical protein